MSQPALAWLSLRTLFLSASGAWPLSTGGLVPVVALNCSGAPGCHLDGVTISSAGTDEGKSHTRQFSALLDSSAIGKSNTKHVMVCQTKTGSGQNEYEHSRMNGRTACVSFRQDNSVALLPSRPLRSAFTQGRSTL